MISCILFRYKYRRACGEKHLFFPAGCFIRSHLQKMSSHIKTNLNLISFSSFNSGEAFSYPLERHIVSAINIDIAKTIVDMLLGFKMISIKPFTFYHPLYPVFASQILSRYLLSMQSFFLIFVQCCNRLLLCMKMNNLPSSEPGGQSPADGQLWPFRLFYKFIGYGIE